MRIRMKRTQSQSEGPPTTFRFRVGHRSRIALWTISTSLAVTLLPAPATAVEPDCRHVSIKKVFVGVPDTCSFDVCEIWRSTAALGPGNWNLGVDFSDFVPAPNPPPGQEGALFFGTGTDTFVARNGDTLDAVNAVASNANSFLAAGIVHIIGGTGRFSNASGQLFIRVDNAVGRARISGELCGVPATDGLGADDS